MSQTTADETWVRMLSDILCFFSIMVGFVLFVSRNQEVIFKYILTHIAEFLIHTDQSPVRVIRKKEAQTRNIQHIVSYCTENS